METTGFEMTEIRVERIGLDGDGRAGSVRVPTGLPGELWSGSVEDNVLIDGQILSPSPERVNPPCVHHQVCGGCSLQHMATGAQAEWKRGFVTHALESRGISVEVRPTVTSPPRSRRRAVMTGRRTRKTVTLGFHGRRSDGIFDLRECQVLVPEVLEAKALLDRLVVLAASRSGEVKLSVTHGPAGLDIALETAKPLDAEMGTRLAEIAEDADFARVSWNGDVVSLRRDAAQEFVGGARVMGPPGGFLQATAHGEKILVDHVLETVGQARRAVDLFCGSGTFTLPLARGAEVLAVEGSAEMVQALDAGWRQAQGLKRVQARMRDLFRRPVLASEFKGFEAVVIDPPRAGAEAQMHELAKSDVPRIAAVSCNPVTFARDAQILVEGGYRLEAVQPVDQFLWSTHVELAARFSR